MNRTIVKSLIIVTAIVFAVGGVLFFLLSVVSPPNEIEKNNAHEIDIEHHVSDYHPDSLSLSEAEFAMDCLHDRASLFYSDSLISDNSYDDAVMKTTNNYALSFINWSHNKFNQEFWYAKDHNEMKRIMSKVRGITVEQGSRKALEPQIQSSLTEIEDVISDYNTAWGVSYRTTFSTLDDASRKITEARKYKNKEYLKNCYNLVDALDHVAEKLEKSHFNQLICIVNSLANYKSVGKTDYINKSKDVQSKLKEYDDRATSVYGAKQDVSGLTKRAGDYYNEAMEYYKKTEVTAKYNPSCSTTSANRGCKITQVQLNQNYTRVTLSYNNYYSHAEWVTIDPKTYIVDQQGNRHYMIRAEGIPTDPQKHYFNSANESLTFTLIFDRLPLNTTSFDLIESESSSWKFYNIKIN